MIIHSIRHRGLRHLIENDDPRYLSRELVSRIRNILTVLVLSEDIQSFISYAPPGWRVHKLTGDRQDEWSVSVSWNWRITFIEQDGHIDRLNLEDYH